MVVETTEMITNQVSLICAVYDVLWLVPLPVSEIILRIDLYMNIYCSIGRIYLSIEMTNSQLKTKKQKVLQTIFSN